MMLNRMFTIPPCDPATLNVYCFFWYLLATIASADFIFLVIIVICVELERHTGWLYVYYSTVVRICGLKYIEYC